MKSDRSTARLALEDGTVFEGESFGSRSPTAGEVVFNTGMVGYPESLTDPSYEGQILVLTYPLVGNYGVPAPGVDEWGLPRGFESHRICVKGLVVAQRCDSTSHRTAHRSLSQWLGDEGIPGVTGVDTRALTKRLREKGTLLGRIEVDGREMPFCDPNATDLVSRVSVSRPEKLPGPIPDDAPSVLLVDCGAKASIARALARRGLSVTRVPHDYYFLDLPYDGVVLSNGPGDPQRNVATIRNVGRAMAVGKPILGVCLGSQMLALAAGAETYKLKFGHRGQNQPCVEHELAGGPGPRCYITSQNHGYAVKGETLPPDWAVWFTNANDGTIEGLRHVSKPFYGVQFHPEASPGPLDTAWLFDRFADEVRRRR